MPRAYTPEERTQLMDELREAGLQSILAKGVRKTTVDDLVRQVRIPKGTFYLLFPSKEVLLFEALVGYGLRVQGELMDTIEAANPTLTIDGLTDILVAFYEQELGNGLAQLLADGELEALVRKLPDELLTQEVQRDTDFLAQWITVFSGITPEQCLYFSAAFRAVFLSSVFRREIGPFASEALRLMVRGLVMQLWEARDDSGD